MKFNSLTLKLTAEQFFQYTNKIDVGIRAKSKSYDLWAKILSGKTYSPLSSNLSSNAKEIEYELNTETIIELFHEKGRTIDKEQAIKIFANAISFCLPDISRQCSNIVKLLKSSDTHSVIAAHPEGLGLIEDSKPGYLKISGFSFSNYDRASDMEGLILELAGQPAMQQLNVYAGMHRSSDKLGNQKFKSLLTENTDFPIFMSERLFKRITLNEQYATVESRVADTIHDYFRKAGIEHENFLSLNTPMVEDFIQSISGSVMSCIEFYASSDDDELVLNIEAFEFLIRQKIEFYTGN